MTKPTIAEELACNGCGKSEDQVLRVWTLKGCFVCNECVDMLTSVEASAKEQDAIDKQLMAQMSNATVLQLYRGDKE